eukprot:TRINITY_DN65050_c0_g2_i1.p1 TRINITY_DN65050_c0_g2~~TRINITY_DN65050_c0_g2_i1.p1  ORF type:complete len:669 (+),score=148.92 TRINITY_DN65050_c0_g2_i1:32-2038(+)
MLRRGATGFSRRLLGRSTCGHPFGITGRLLQESQAGDEKPRDGASVGIDLGTTNSVVAVLEGNEPRVLENAEGSRTTPSIVAFKGSQTLVGIAAKRQAVTNPENTFYATKRYIGRPYADFREAAKKVPYKLIEHKNGDCWFKTTDGKELSPQQIAAMVLEKMKATAEDHLGSKVANAVVTVPAYFNETQKRATKDAGVIAGLNVMRIINEPTAAALAYGLNKDKDVARTIAVYDLGGGTFDVSILEIASGVFEVKATNGDTYLGGEDFENTLTEHILTEFRKENGVDLTDKVALQRIREAAETAKIELSSTLQTEIYLPYITAVDKQTLNISMDLSRSKFESLTEGLVNRTVGPCKKAMSDAELKNDDLTDVILVGGMTRMPKVVTKVQEIFGREPSKSVNPDEVVAMGAAAQVAVLTGKMKDVVLLDVIPLSLGIETLGGVFTRIIEKNTTIPVKKTQIFSTAQDSQTQVGIKVFQGEREMALENKCLGNFDLHGIPPAPRGVPQIEVAFDIDASGLMHVTAKDKATNKDASITISAGGGLTKDEIKRMQQEAEDRKEEDMSRREKVEVLNAADQSIHDAQKAQTDCKDAAEDKLTTLGEKITALKDIIANQDNYNKDSIDEAVQALKKAMYDVTSDQYQKSSQQGGEQQQGQQETTEEPKKDFKDQ